MNTKEREIAEKLRALTVAFGQQLPARLKEIRQLWLALCHEPTKHNHDNVHRISHSLAGTSATFGFTNLSVAARELENILARIEPPYDISPPLSTEIEEKLAVMDQLLTECQTD